MVVTHCGRWWPPLTLCLMVAAIALIGQTAAQDFEDILGMLDADDWTQPNETQLYSDETTLEANLRGFQRSECGKAPLNRLSLSQTNHYHQRDRHHRHRKGHPIATPHIINGEDQIYGEWPSFVSIASRHRFATSNCGGTLISDRHILTAIHCLYEGQTSNLPISIRVTLGTHLKDEYDQHEITLNARIFCLSQLYNQRAQDSPHDWALLELERPVSFNEHIQPACLPRSGPPKTSGGRSQCYTVGLGISYRGRRTPRVVQKLRVQQVSCWLYGIGPNDVSRVCYNRLDDSRGTTCNGDSGGPVLCLDDRGRWTVTGVTSFGDMNCFNSNPGVMSNVHKLLNSIDEVCFRRQG